MGEGVPVEPDQPGDGARYPVRVLVSYAHDDAAHVEQVRVFWQFLRANGIDARIDLSAAGQRQDWAAWMSQQVHEAERILVIASPAYKRRAEGNAMPAEGRGVQWEARLIRDRFYADQGAGLQAVVPVVLPDCSAEDIPSWLSPASATHYVVSEFTVAGAETLLRLLTGQAHELEPPLGRAPVLLPRDAMGTAPPAVEHPGASRTDPGPPADGAPHRTGTTLAALGQVSAALTAIRPSASWTLERWMQEATELRAILVMLGGQLSRLPSDIGSQPGSTRRAIQVNAAIAELKELTGQVRASLIRLQDSATPSGERAREFSVFTGSADDLQQAITHFQAIVDATDAAQTRTVPRPPELEYAADEQAWYHPSPPECDETERGRIENLRWHIDAVLITANETELLAVLAQLRPPPRRRKPLLVYWGPETYYIGRFGECLVAVSKCRMGALGDGSVILATDLAQRVWRPRAVIMVGVAFGKSWENQKIADVIVASQVVSYEQQRVGAEIVFRGPVSPANGTLLNRFENAADWRFYRPDKIPCSLIVGPVLSGEKLVDDPDFKKALLKQFPQAVGGEMEGAGLCAATGRIGTAWILVKGICDWADGRKDSRHQPLAAAAATSLVLHVLSRRTALLSIERPVSW